MQPQKPDSYTRPSPRPPVPVMTATGTVREFRYPSYAVISTSRNHRSRASVYLSIPNHNPSGRVLEWLLLHFDRSCIPPVAPEHVFRYFQKDAVIITTSTCLGKSSVRRCTGAPSVSGSPRRFPKGETTGGMLYLYLVGSLLQCFRPVPLQELS